MTEKEPKAAPAAPIGALTEEEAAAYLRVSRSFLRQSRMTGNRIGHAPGPKYVQAGRMIRYPVKLLDEWLEQHLVEPKPAPSEAA